MKLCQTNNQLKNYPGQLLKKLKKRKLYSSFKDKIQGADLDDMKLIGKYNNRFGFLLCVIDKFSKYTWFVDKKGITISNVFQTALGESHHKPNKIWVDKGSESYNRSIKSWLQDNHIEM